MIGWREGLRDLRIYTSTKLLEMFQVVYTHLYGLRKLPLLTPSGASEEAIKSVMCVCA